MVTPPLALAISILLDIALLQCRGLHVYNITQVRLKVQKIDVPELREVPMSPILLQ